MRRRLRGVIGTLANAGCILLAGVAVWARVPPLPPAAQRRLQVLLAVVTMGLGFHVIWRSLHGSCSHVIGQLGILGVAIVLGKLTGQALGVQSRLNRLGGFARERLTGGEPAAGRPSWSDIFAAATVVFCLTPLAVVGPLLEGLGDDIRVLLAKGVIDGLTTLSLARTRGWSVLLAAVPVLSFQGSLSLAAALGQERLAATGVTDAVCGTGGYLLVAVAMVMLQVLKIRLGDYLPALLWAALLGWLAG